jgi:hypothetical protein
VYLLFALMYQYAYKKRRELELNDYEALCTRDAVIHFGGYVGVGILVAIAAVVLPSRYVGYAGFLFCLNAVWGWGVGSILGKQQRLLLARMEAGSAANPAR